MKKKTILTTSTLLVVALVLTVLASCIKPTVDGENSTSMNDKQIEDSSLSVARSEFLSDLEERWDEIVSARHEDEKINISSDDWAAFETIVALIESDKDAIIHSEYSALFVGYDTNGEVYLSLDDRYPLTEVQSNALGKVAKLFQRDNVRLDLIRVERNQITFDTTMRYAVVYMDNDEKPPHLSKVYDKPGYSLSVEKIRPHWYHVFADSNE